MKNNRLEIILIIIGRTSETPASRLRIRMNPNDILHKYLNLIVDNLPIAQKPFPIPYKLRDAVATVIDELLSKRSYRTMCLRLGQPLSSSHEKGLQPRKDRHQDHF